MLSRVILDTNPWKMMWRCEFSMFSVGIKKKNAIAATVMDKSVETIYQN